jgi:hypothetical protein
MPVVINGTSGITGNTGTLISATTIGVGGATPSGSGAGITFPATQSASSDANTLDDYEEGTWNISISDGTTSVGPFIANYVKIGKIVTIQFTLYQLNITTLSTSAQLRITGLPFSAAFEQFYANGGIWANDSGRNYFINTEGTIMRLWESLNINDVTLVSRSDFSNTTNMSFYGTYSYISTN